MSDQHTRDAEEAARKLGACLDDVHVNCVLLAPGAERVNGVVKLCAISERSTPFGVQTCARRPVYRCVDCGAFVCEQHAGKLCPAVSENGRPCILRLVPDSGGYHHHEYAR